MLMIGYRYTACNRCQCVYGHVIDASAPLTCVLLASVYTVFLSTDSTLYEYRLHVA